VDLAGVLLANALAIIALMSVVWLISVPRRDVSIVDIAWGPGFGMVAWFTLVVADGADARRLLLAALTSIWGLRLGAYLAWRNLGRGEDRRYAAMRAHRPGSFWWWSLPFVFGVQAVLMWIVSLPIQAAGGQRLPEGLVALDVLGIVLWCVGYFFESVGDAQLARFKADPANRGKVMDSGLWRYTRHPNYFGDFMVWWGIYAIALATGDAWWTIVGPITMSVLLIKGTGAALLEKTIGERRPGYDQYVQRTSRFIPLPPKRASA